MNFFFRIFLMAGLMAISTGSLKGQSKKVRDSLALLEQRIAQLPLTKTKSRGVSSAKSKYELLTDFESEQFTIKDIRILNQNGEPNPNDGYLISVPMAALHKEGVLLMEDKENASISINVLAAENKPAFSVTPLMAKEARLDFPQDRFLLGPWKSDDPALNHELDRIQSLFSWIAKKVGVKKNKQIPAFERDTEQTFKAQVISSEVLTPGTKGSARSALPAIEMDHPPLFQQATDLASCQKAVETYLLQQLKERDIHLKFAVQGKFIVNEQGKVNFVRIDFAMDKGAKQLIEDILKNMPVWKVGRHEEVVRSALVSFSLKAKK